MAPPPGAAEPWLSELGCNGPPRCGCVRFGSGGCGLGSGVAAALDGHRVDAPVGGDDLGMAKHGIGLAVGDNRAAVHDDHAVGHGAHERDLVLGDHTAGDSLTEAWTNTTAPT